MKRYLTLAGVRRLLHRARRRSRRTRHRAMQRRGRGAGNERRVDRLGQDRGAKKRHEARCAAPATEPAADDIPKTKSPGVFVPSEDISEDLAVSFPVDI